MFEHPIFFTVVVFLIFLSAWWLLFLWRFIKLPRPDNFDDSMSQGFRIILGGIILIGVWIGLIMGFLK
jgi:hypothetical protein